MSDACLKLKKETSSLPKTSLRMLVVKSAQNGQRDSPAGRRSHLKSMMETTSDMNKGLRTCAVKAVQSGQSDSPVQE